jgi:hypothetical protein
MEAKAEVKDTRLKGNLGILVDFTRALAVSLLASESRVTIHCALYIDYTRHIE